MQVKWVWCLDIKHKVRRAFTLSKFTFSVSHEMCYHFQSVLLYLSSDRDICVTSKRELGECDDK